MLAPRFVETSSVVRRDREEELRHHQQHLTEILKQKRRLDLSPLRTPRKSPIGGFLHSARQNDILRENKALFERLLAISKGKWCPFPLSPTHSSPKSLNSLNRLRDAQKRMQENSFLAERIVNKTGLVGTKKIIKDYEDVRRYRERISKVRVFTQGKHRGKTANIRVSTRQSISAPPEKKAETLIESSAKPE
jgi:hypothetical protein